MNKMKIRTYGNFVFGHYHNDKDIVRRKDITDNQIMDAIDKSKVFNVRDWFGDVDEVKFTITNIEKTEYGDYIYTIESNSDNVPVRYFPSPHQILIDNDTIASPISYVVIEA